MAERNLKRRLKELDKQAHHKLARYSPDPKKPGDRGKPDSALLVINQIVKNEPKLKYTPSMAAHTFISLLLTNPHKAYAYGKELLAASTDETPLEYFIYENIQSYENKLNLPAEIYRLGIEAYQAEMNTSQETDEFPGFYHQMAAWHWRTNDKSKAIATEQKAIEALKSQKNFSAADLAEYESRLQQYRNK